MSLEATHDFSIQDLLRLLNERLVSECIRMQEISPSQAGSLESEVSTHRPILVPIDVAVSLTPVGCIDRQSRN